ncbi:MAG: TrbI/VirB10 family protein [Bryobacteraceae bacterium]|jgi:type IV secretion system protein VirB10
MPKHLSAYVIMAVSLGMVAILAFSGGGTSKATAKAAPTPADRPLGNARIEEFKKDLEDQSQKLKDEQVKLSQAKQNFEHALQGTAAGSGPVPPGGVPVTGASMQGGPAGQYPPGYYEPAYRAAYARQGEEPQAQLANEKAKREYASLFASNVALTYRKGETLPPQEQPTPAPQSPYERALQAYQSAAAAPLPNAPGPAASAPATGQGKAVDPPGHAPEALAEGQIGGKYKTPPELEQASGKQYRLFEGTVFEAVLTNRLNGTYVGPVNCMVTTDVYSLDMQHLLIPQGSRILGEARRVDTFGQERLAVFFHRIVMPDGYSVSLDQFKGLNQIGETGLRDKVNHHYLQTFGAALAIGAVAGFSTANTTYGIGASGTDMYRQGVASSLSQSSTQILDKFLNIMPTVTIREGHRVKVYLAGDLLVPDYRHHTMPSDI